MNCECDCPGCTRGLHACATCGGCEACGCVCQTVPLTDDMRAEIMELVAGVDVDLNAALEPTP